MEDSLFEYFNGVSSKSYQVRIEVIKDEIYVFDTSYNQDNGLRYSLKDCSYVVLKNNAFIYLNKGATEYIVVPLHSEFYVELATAIKNADSTWYTKLLQQKWYTLGGGVAIILITVYLFFTFLVPPIVLKFVSAKEEISIGNNFYSSVTEGEHIDTAGTFIIQKFADNLKLSKTYPINVTVVDDSIVNAFALPGGHIVVYSGIINKLENAQELVALLSHETSHVNKRHSLASMASRFSTSLLFSVITKDFNGVSKGLIENVNMLQVLKYSRQLESEADYEGMKLMVSNNINPVGMKWLMEDLKKLNREIPASMSFLSTHPLTDQRINDADLFCIKYKEMNAPVPDVQQSLWEELRKVCNTQ